MIIEIKMTDEEVASIAEFRKTELGKLLDAAEKGTESQSKLLETNVISANEVIYKIDSSYMVDITNTCSLHADMLLKAGRIVARSVEVLFDGLKAFGADIDAVVEKHLNK